LIGAKIDPKTIANVLKEKLIIVKLHFKKLKFSIKGALEGAFRGLESRGR
jgi:hypothetical protein